MDAEKNFQQLSIDIEKGYNLLFISWVLLRIIRLNKQKYENKEISETIWQITNRLQNNDSVDLWQDIWKQLLEKLTTINGAFQKSVVQPWLPAIIEYKSAQ